MELYCLKRNSRAAVTPCPGSGWSEQDCRVLKFWSVVAVSKMRAESTLLRIALISASLVTPASGAAPTATRGSATTSRMLFIGIRFFIWKSPWQHSQDLMGRQIILAHEPKTAQEPEPDSPSCLSLLYSLESG